MSFLTRFHSSSPSSSSSSVLRILHFRLTHIRRPLCFLVLIYLLILILFQLIPQAQGPDLSAAEDRRLLISGRVISKETSASGCSLLLGDIRFPPKEEPDGEKLRRSSESTSGADESQKNATGPAASVYESFRRKLSAVWPSRGRISVFLNVPSEGSVSATVYGDRERQSLWVNASKLIDQSGIYRQARIGTTITLYGKCSLPDPATNPGQFDARNYSRARNIFLKMSQVTLKKAGHGRGSLYLNFLADLRFRLKQAALAVFGEKNCVLIDAIVLGDRSGLDARTRTLFQDGGILHILAVSSLHVTLLGLSLYKLLRKMRKGFLFSSFWAAGLVISFCLMTGNSYSAVRATVTFLFWLGAQIFGRTCDRLTALSAAALVILVRQPFALTDTGFILSFSCILSIELIGPVFTKIWSPKKEVLVSLTGSAALEAGILPLSLWFFYQTAPYGILLNLIVLPSMSLFMVFGFLGCLAGLLVPLGSFFLIPAKAVAGPCAYLLQLFRLLCSLTEKLSGGLLITGKPPLYKMILYYSLLVFFCLFISHMSQGQLLKKRRKVRLLSSLFLVSLTLLMILHGKPSFSYTCLDVGQGSCNLVQKDGFVMLFDAGSSSVSDIYRYRIESTLKYFGISKIDLVFLSHGDSDHICAIPDMLDGYHPSLTGGNAGGISISRILVPDLNGNEEEYSGLEEVIEKAQASGIPVSAVSEGDIWKIGRNSDHEEEIMTLRVLSPSPDRMTGETNQDCIVLLLRIGKVQILFTGDLEKEGEEMFTEAYTGSPLFSSPEDTENILVVGHHGSRNASSDAFLSLTRPDLAVISCGKNNRYGHPSRQVLGRLRKRHIPYIRTDRTGAFTMTPKQCP